jgi:hypothetical protein
MAAKGNGGSALFVVILRESGNPFFAFRNKRMKALITYQGLSCESFAYAESIIP